MVTIQLSMSPFYFQYNEGAENTIGAMILSDSIAAEKTTSAYW